MKAFKALANTASYGLKRMFRQTSISTGVQSGQIAKRNPYVEPHSKHRSIVPLYDLEPLVVMENFIAPNATLVGEVLIGVETIVWYGAVIRGDMNQVRIGNNSVIGENTVIHTAGSLPTGLPAVVEIGQFVNIANGCTLYSCSIDDNCHVGFKTVILEGSRLEKGCAIGPNSVVPPGRIIPAGQLWAGNPVEYVRDLEKSEIHSTNNYIKQQFSIAQDHMYEFLPYNSAYLQKENIDSDTNIAPEEYRDRVIIAEDL